LRRVLREELLLREERRAPLLPRATGEEPVAVEMAADMREAGLALVAARPQTLQ
jgi:hypothetical protein